MFKKWGIDNKWQNPLDDGSHLGIQDGSPKSYGKKWNQLKFCCMDHKDEKKHWFQKCRQTARRIT